MAYETLQIGSTNAEEVKKMQTALQEKGYYKDGQVDGVYSDLTAAAVRQYQQDNKLQADGVAGNETLGHLYRTSTQLPDYRQQLLRPEESASWKAANEKLQQAQSQLPQLTDRYTQQLNALYDRLVNQPDFSYNINEDALFRQYRDRYVQAGQLAMQDAMGQAAAYTGGYGSSYGQAVGQQTYQGYLQQLTDVIPQLEQQAYSRYQDDRNQLLQQYSLLWDQSERDYSRYQDELNRYWQNVDYYQALADQAYQREQATGQLGLQLQENAYSKLQSLIATGYNPTAEELAEAGMTAAQAAAIKKAYTSSRSSGSSGLGGNSEAYVNLKALGLDDYPALQKYLLTQHSLYGYEKVSYTLNHWKDMGYVNDAAVNTMLGWVTNPEDFRQDAVSDNNILLFQNSVMSEDEFNRRGGAVKVGNKVSYNYQDYVRKWLGHFASGKDKQLQLNELEVLKLKEMYGL